jgi:hypothetical protein
MTMGFRRLLRAGLAALGVATLIVTAGSTAAAEAERPVRSCAALATLKLRDTTILGTTAGSGPAHCAVRLVVTNPPSGDRVTVGVWLPDRWNGRFQGLGGGGFSGGSPFTTPAGALRAGYAVAATDAGHAGGGGSFAVGPDGTPDEQLIADFAYLGIHEMTVAAQELVRSFYGVPRFRSYFNGCSTGGRQGLMEAQRYPADYDGIAAGAPAINWTRLQAAQLWGPMLMRLAHHEVPPCVLTAVTRAAVRACDPLDGRTDGVIGDWRDCHFDARTLIGAETACGTVTATDADIINKIWDGPRGFWYGLERGADLTVLNDASQPFRITDEWYRYWLGQDWRTLTYEQYLRSATPYQDVMATDDPDLSAFRAAGGRLVVWHGTADQLIPVRGSVDYFRRLGDAGSFARLFVAPGVAHCGGGPGAAPRDPLGAVVRWVEKGVAPDRLAGTHGRPVCRYGFSCPAA